LTTLARWSAGTTRPSGRVAARPGPADDRRPRFRLVPGAVDNAKVTAPVPKSVVGTPVEFGDVLERARRGCPESTRWLYESVAGRVCGYLRVHGAPEPDDLTSEVFLRVFDHLDGFVGDEGGYRSWVFTIAQRLLIDDHRRRARRPEAVELSVPVQEAVPGGDAESDALRAVGDGRVAEVLAQLVPDQRDVLALRVVGDLTVDQVAEILGKSRGAVKALQRRALAAVRRSLEEATS
jgi:RNA polymerase sigma-70 factor (ECF subfamily)